MGSAALLKNSICANKLYGRQFKNQECSLIDLFRDIDMSKTGGINSKKWPEKRPVLHLFYRVPDWRQPFLQIHPGVNIFREGILQRIGYWDAIEMIVAKFQYSGYGG